MSRPFWHWQAGLEVAVDTARHQLDHAVRVEMKLATLQGLGRGIICRGSAALAGLLRAAQLHQLTARKRLTQSAQRVHASASSIEAPGVESIMAA